MLTLILIIGLPAFIAIKVAGAVVDGIAGTIASAKYGKSYDGWDGGYDD